MPKTSPSISAAATTKAAAAIAISFTEVLLPSALLAAAPPDLPDLADLTEPLFAAEAAAADLQKKAKSHLEEAAEFIVGRVVKH